MACVGESKNGGKLCTIVVASAADQHVWIRANDVIYIALSRSIDSIGEILSCLRLRFEIIPCVAWEWMVSHAILEFEK